MILFFLSGEGAYGGECTFIYPSYIIGLLKALNNPLNHSHMPCPQKYEEGRKKK